MKFDVISSGSKGNSTLVISGKDCILLDFGISKRKIDAALTEFGLSFSDIEAFICSHTHSDHVSQLFNAPVEKTYVSEPKVSKINHVFSGEHVFRPLKSFDIGVFHITPIPLSHDAKNTCGFLVEDGEQSLVYLTDTGFVPEKNMDLIKGKNYYIFESNHDPKMLYESGRPDYLIRRIISDTGHLSNEDSAYYLSQLITKDTREVVLAHLSDECNTPELAKRTFECVTQQQLGYIPDVILKAANDRGTPIKGGDL